MSAVSTTVLRPLRFFIGLTMLIRPVFSSVISFLAVERLLCSISKLERMERVDGVNSVRALTSLTHFSVPAFPLMVRGERKLMVALCYYLTGVCSSDELLTRLNRCVMFVSI